VSRHRRKQRRSFPWPMLVFGGLLLIVAAFLFANKAGSNGGTGTPGIAVDQEKIDYGYVKFGTNETFRIKVTNNGDDVLRFEETPYIEFLEGC
jgi:mannose-1-phosphate guanylyltransferase